MAVPRSSQRRQRSQGSSLGLRWPKIGPQDVCVAAAWAAGSLTMRFTNTMDKMRLINEFAMVEVEQDVDANGDRLKIYCPASGRTVYLDPQELERLTWMGPELFARLLETPFGPTDD